MPAEYVLILMALVPVSVVLNALFAGEKVDPLRGHVDTQPNPVARPNPLRPPERPGRSALLRPVARTAPNVIQMDGRDTLMAPLPGDLLGTDLTEIHHHWTQS